MIGRHGSNETMVTPLPHRRPFSGKVRTSVLKRRVRFVRWLARLRGRGAAPMTCRYLGADFIVTPGELIADEIAINRIEWRELAMMLAACREFRPHLFVDVGANVGLYSCILGRAQAVPRVVAFEPDRHNFKGLAANIARNGLRDIVDARPVAIGAAAGTASLVPGTPENSGLSKLGDADPRAYSVPVVTLDGEIDLRDAMICMKIDVEDYELEALAGAADLLRRNGGYVQIEGQGDARAAEITAIMRGHGWRFIDRYGLNLRFERPAPIGPP
jgi:FkbM family methyltransferase